VNSYSYSCSYSRRVRRQIRSSNVVPPADGIPQEAGRFEKTRMNEESSNQTLVRRHGAFPLLDLPLVSCFGFSELPARSRPWAGRISDFPSGGSYHFDALGSTRLITDYSGEATDYYSYDAWGNVSHDTGSLSQPYQYVGQLGYYTHYQDVNFPLLQLGVRFYDPGLGRFTQVDPINDGLNWYAYVHDRPLAGTDPRGLQWPSLCEYTCMTVGNAMAAACQMYASDKAACRLYAMLWTNRCKALCNSQCPGWGTGIPPTPPAPGASPGPGPVPKPPSPRPFPAPSPLPGPPLPWDYPHTCIDDMWGKRLDGGYIWCSLCLNSQGAWFWDCEVVPWL